MNIKIKRKRLYKYKIMKKIEKKKNYVKYH